MDSFDFLTKILVNIKKKTSLYVTGFLYYILFKTF